MANQLNLDFERKGFKRGSLVQIAIWMRDFPRLSYQLSKLSIQHPMPPHWQSGCNVDEYAALLAQHRATVEKIFSLNAVQIATQIAESSNQTRDSSRPKPFNFQVKKRSKRRICAPVQALNTHRRKNRRKVKQLRKTISGALA